MIGQETLDCQNCGIVLKELSNAEAQKVARDPYKFIAFCGPCGRDEFKALKEKSESY